MKMLMAVALAGVLMLATGCGGGGGSKTASTPTPTPTPTPAPEPTMTTWEQLPGVVDTMDRRTQFRSRDLPGPSCNDSVSDCQAAVKSLLAAATEPTGTTRRLQGTRTVQTDGGVSVTGNYWGAWLDNSIFIAETINRPEPSDTGSTIYVRYISMGIRDTNPVAGTYRGEAVDRDGNWGTSELTYTSADTGERGGQIGMAINIPAHSGVGIMRWPNFSFDGSSHFDNGIRNADNVVGPNILAGRFYQGGEVGGVFVYRRSLTIGDSIGGAFGAKRTPDTP